MFNVEMSPASIPMDGDSTLVVSANGYPSSGFPPAVDSNDGHYDPGTRRGRKRLWCVNELQQLSEIVRRFRLPSGRIRWTSLALAWENSRAPELPQRSIAALKAAYAKLAKRPRIAEASAPQLGSEIQTDRDEIPIQEGQSAESVGNDTDVDMSTPWALGLQGKLAREFRRFLVVAKAGLSRPPIKKPKGEIPQELLVAGNRILDSRMPETNQSGQEYLTMLNVTVYAMGRAIVAMTNSIGHEQETQDLKVGLKEAIEIRETLRRIIRIMGQEVRRWRVQRQIGRARWPRKKFVELAKLYSIQTHAGTRILLREFKDRLKVTLRQIKGMEQSRRIMQERRQGYSYLIRNSGAPTMEIPVASVREYWKSIIGKARPFQVSDELKEWARRLGVQQAPERANQLTESQWKALFDKTRPWKAAGPDGIPAYFWKHLRAARDGLKQWCIQAWANPKVLPKWLCRGKVVLLPKACEGERGPGDYRPIACLNTCYKILTATVAAQIFQSTEQLFPREQVAMRKGVWGCTHAHILDQTVIRDSIKYGKELHMLWVDFSKAFDSVSHGAVRWILTKWGVPVNLRRLLVALMSKQTVRYYGQARGKLARSKELKVRNGLMQGDTLSPLLFCLTIAPISAWLRAHVGLYKTNMGPRSDGALEMSHILYMDDLKVYATSWEDLVEAKAGIKRIAGQLGLALNARKCAVRSLNGADMHIDRVGVLDTIPVLSATELYKYLGTEQNSLTCIGSLLDRVEGCAKATARTLFLSNLTVGQMVEGYNRAVMPKLKYAYSNVIFGTGRLRSIKSRAVKFDAEIRQLIKEAHLRFQTSCAARLYVSKDLGGLGMMKAEEELERSITYSWCYLASKAELLPSYELAERLRQAGKRSLTSDFQTVLAANGIERRVHRTIIATIVVDDQVYFGATEAARAISGLIHKRWAEKHTAEWRSKRVAGRVTQGFGELPTGLSMRDSFLWSAKGWVAPEVLRNVWAAQEGTLLTRHSPAGRACMPHARGVCRMDCAPGALETAEHIVSSCSHWRTNIMVERHDDVARVLYCSIRRKYRITREVNTHEPHVLDMRHVVIYWNSNVWTSESLAHNRPDILVWDKVAKRIWIIEVSVSWYTRVHQQELRKLSKYGVNSTLPEDTGVSGFYPGPNLKAALQRDRQSRVDVVPVVIGACGEVTPNLRRYVRMLQLPEKTDDLIERMERAAVQGTNRLIKSHLANGSVNISRTSQ